jgi:plastocyanin
MRALRDITDIFRSVRFSCTRRTLLMRWGSGGLALFVLFWPRSDTQAQSASSAMPAGLITGVVALAGEAPKPKPIEITTDPAVCATVPHFDEALQVGPDHGIANAVVSISDASNAASSRPQSVPEEIRIDQHRCRYEPHVAAFPAGATVVITNSDGILHNVHIHSKLNGPMNLAQPGFKKTLRIKLSRPEIVHVTCDEHNWMSGWWFVAANPFYAVTDREGRFRITGVPPGRYQLDVWQEELGKASKPVTVEAGHVTIVNFVLAPPR